MKQLVLLMSFMVFGIVSQAQTNPPAKLHANKCLGTTKAGQPCKSTIIMKDGYCRSHSPNTPKCGATTSAGKPCKMAVEKAGDKCRFHSK
jgi:hypothetical protein